MCCWKTAQLGAGNNRIVFTSKGDMYVGQTGRGWASGVGLKKVSWNGTVPFELFEVNLTSEGFKLTFTKPVDKKQALELATYKIRKKQLHFYFDKNFIRKTIRKI